MAKALGGQTDGRTSKRTAHHHFPIIFLPVHTALLKRGKANITAGVTLEYGALLLLLASSSVVGLRRWLQQGLVAWAELCVHLHGALDFSFAFWYFSSPL